jgi:hypothetical protein
MYVHNHHHHSPHHYHHDHHVVVDPFYQPYPVVAPACAPSPVYGPGIFPSVYNGYTDPMCAPTAYTPTPYFSFNGLFHNCSRKVAIGGSVVFLMVLIFVIVMSAVPGAWVHVTA